MDGGAESSAAEHSDEDEHAALAALPSATDNPLECDRLNEAPLVFLLKKLYRGAAAAVRAAGRECLRRQPGCMPPGRRQAS
jgi:hypothetical protein